jgi:hypothetical protein
MILTSPNVYDYLINEVVENTEKLTENIRDFDIIEIFIGILRLGNFNDFLYLPFNSLCGKGLGNS